MRGQCEMLGVNRSGLYHQSVGSEPEKLELMRRIDELHLEFPFYPSRRMARELRGQGLGLENGSTSWFVWSFENTHVVVSPIFAR